MTTATRASTQNRIPTGSWSVDPVHSSVGFEVKHMVVSTFRGNFGQFDALLEASEDESRLVGTARVESVDVRDENLAAHLAGEEFFDAGHHPEIRFESSAIRVGDEGDVAAEGELTVKGRTKVVEARGRLSHVTEDISGGERIGLSLEATVDRREFGLEWNAPLPKGGFALGNDVKLVVALELVPKDV